MSVRRRLAWLLIALIAQPPAWAAKPGDVLAPNTLPTGGAVLSGNVTINAAVSSGTSSLLRIDQSSQQAVIQWSSFNIGSASTVRFYQPSATAEALNRILDADPTIIQGQLIANGRVYLVNQNGILFDRGSQVNVRGLIASSLDIPDSVFQGGVFAGKLDQPVASGLLRLLLDPQGHALSDLEGQPLYNNVDNYGQIRSVDPDSGGSPGGFVMLFAPRVSNHGLIVADNGQVVLAAGEKVYLSSADSYFTPYTDSQLGAATQGSNPLANAFTNDRLSMRGMLVEVAAGSAPLDVSSIVANHGTVRADRGNVTLAALAVNQAGMVSAGSAVSQNGSVFLIARENNQDPSLGVARSGTLTLAPGSVTQTPLIDDGTTLPDSQPYWPYRSRLRLEGGVIDIAGTISAPGALVGIRAGNAASPGTARVFVDDGALIDVKGSDADVPLASNFYTFKVTSDDLKNAPDQKNGFLLGQTVTVDLRRGSPLLFDLSAAAANVQRSVEEKAATGGDIAIQADQVITRAGSVIEVSGGAWNVQGGRIATSWVGSGGRYYDISTAPTDLTYDSVVSGTFGISHGRWGVTQQFVGPAALAATYEAPYVEGKAAGSLTIDSAQLVLDGTLRGGVTVGPRQIASAAMPQAGLLVLGDPTTANSDSPQFRLPGFGFANGAATVLPAQFGLSDPLPDSAQKSVTLRSDLLQDFGALQLYGRGALEVPAGVTIAGGSGASLTAYTTGDIRVDGDIRLPSGSVSLNARGLTAQLVLAPGAAVSTAGRWINAYLPGAALEPAVIDGGSIALSGNGVTLGTGSLLDVSGGAQLSASGKISSGDAGSITLLPAAIGNPAALDQFGALALQGELRGYSAGGKGGTLNLTAATLLIGDAPARNARDLVLAPDFFEQRGFASFKLAGYFDLEVAAGAQLHPLVATRVIDPSAAQRQPSGADLSTFSSPTFLTADLRPAASLALSSLYYPGGGFDPVAANAPGGLSIGAGALIETDPRGAISLRSHSSMDIAGTLSAPAGTIALSLRTDIPQYGGETLHVAPTAQLLARGAFVETPNASGLLQGTLLAGGSVSFDVYKNNLVLDAGSLVDVSGTAAQVDLPRPGTGGAVYARGTLGSEGGMISVAATENATLAGTLLARGAAGAAGGTLAVDLAYHGDTTPGDPRLANTRHEIVLTQSNPAIATDPAMRSVTLAADTVNAGGFDSLSLASEEAIRFAGSTQLALPGSVRLDTPELLVAGGADVRIAAGRVALVNTPTRQYRPSTLLPNPVPVPLQAGSGLFSVQADLVELAGNLVLNGVAQARLESRGDLRAVGFPAPFNTTTSDDRYVIETQQALTGSFTSSGDLTLAAAQVYPSTAVRFAIAAPGARLDIVQAPGERAPVLSAGGALSFDAATIEQAGTVLAPLGTLAFNATSKLTLADGSITSVSAAGSTIPFGTTLNGQTLYYGSIDRTQSLPDKQISLTGPSVSIAQSAQIDLAGGGDVQAVEFVPGLGGTSDVLLNSNTYAIVPDLRFAPFEAYYAGLAGQGSGAAASPYDSVVLGAGGPLPAGRYALLPGYYALLPGAYVVTRQSSSAYRDLPAGDSVTLPDGQVVVSGRLASAASGAEQARSFGFIVQPGTAVLREAEYRISNASVLAGLAQAAGISAPPLPADAGSLSISATSALAFGGDLRTAAADGGAIARIDIAAPQIAVVSQSADAPAGYVALDADRLSGLGASLLLGGTRIPGADGTQLDVVASRVLVANDAAHPLVSNEIILAARDDLTIAPAAGAAAGAYPVLRASGSATTSQANLLVSDPSDDGGALLRLSAGAPVQLLRGPRRGASIGALTIAAGATLAADGSIALDATGDTRANGTLAVAPGGALSIAANKVSLGAAPDGTDGIVISDFSVFGNLGSLALKSYGRLDLFGSLSLGGSSVGTLTLDAPVLGGQGGTSDAAQLQAATLVLQNTAGTLGVPLSFGAGSLRLQADTLVLGEGAKTIAGFSNVVLAANGELRGRGIGSLSVGSDLTLEAARIGGEGGSVQNIAARDASGNWMPIRVTLPAQPAALDQPLAGGKLTLDAAWIEQAGRIELPGGEIDLAAHAAGGDIAFDAGSVLSAAGLAKSFGGETISAAAGRIALSSEQGSIRASANALVDLSGATGGGDAGELVLSAPQGTLQIDAVLRGMADQGWAQGSVAIDVGSIADFSQIDGKLNLGGFTERRDYRVRTGNVTIPGANPFTLRPAARVVAHDFKLVADSGDIVLGGTIDVSDVGGGGSAQLIAGHNLTLLSGSRIDARGTSAANGASNPYSNGGTVEQAAIGGTLSFAQGATIDVSANPAGKSDAGSVVFSAPQNSRADGTPGIAMALAGQVNAGAPAGHASGSVVLEGARSYALPTTNNIATTASASSLSSAEWADFNAFASNAAAIRGDAHLTGITADQISVRAGIELRSSGDMTVNNWDLTTSSWRIGDVVGRLTLRAAGNLDVKGALGLPNDNLPSGATWSLRLVGGADLFSADAMAVIPSQIAGDVLLSQAASRVRTGTGSIEIAAGRDFKINDSSAAIYTAGAPIVAAADGTRARFASGGGDISIFAARDAIGPGDPGWVNNWLRRTTTNSPIGQNGRWWTDRASFKGEIGALGGGDVTITALGSIDRLSAAIPTSGRTLGPVAAPTQLFVAGGGDLRVSAGGDIRGGDYLVGRGSGSLRSRGGVGAGEGVTLFLMGESDDPALRNASFDIEAVGDINLKAAANPTILPLGGAVNNNSPGFGSNGYTFFTYAPTSALRLLSVSGDIVLGNRADLRDAKNSDAATWSIIYPASVMVAALDGSVAGAQPPKLEDWTPASTAAWMPYASADTQVKIFAAQNVSNLFVMPGDAASLPDWAHPTSAQVRSSIAIPALDPATRGSFPRLVMASSGYRYEVIAESLDVSNSVFEFPQQSMIEAGRDLTNLRLDLQNLSPSDESIVAAGRDLRYLPNYADTLEGARHAILMSGPGTLTVRAGRNIDFGLSAGIDALGNLLNSQLPTSTSADVLVMAGVAASHSASEIDALFASLKTAGNAQDAAAGDAAIAALFGAPDGASGSISMVNAGIRTRGNSRIDVLAPHGSIYVGLPTAQSARSSPIEGENVQLGVVTGLGGGINVLVRDDIDVNLSKIVTMLGGDILIYSQSGSIDAGRGPRDSVSSLAPQVDRILATQADGSQADSGLRSFRPPVEAAGSGIRTVSFDPDGPDGPITKPEPGSIYLFASRGFVNAGEAGVSAAGNIVVVAQQVLNAPNFSAGGSTSGVPAAQAGIAGAALASASGASSAAARSDDLTRGLSSSAAQGAPFRPSFITVEVLGFGEEAGSKQQQCGDRQGCKQGTE